jgi:hypothetical protein
MIKTMLPKWMQTEGAEFVLELMSATALVVAATHWFLG